jgi:cytochrome P450
MEITVALEEWLKRFPRFALRDGARIAWSKGPVRGPRTVPVRLE